MKTVTWFGWFVPATVYETEVACCFQRVGCLQGKGRDHRECLLITKELSVAMRNIWCSKSEKTRSPFLFFQPLPSESGRRLQEEWEWAGRRCHLYGACNEFAHFTPTTVYLIRKRCPPVPDLEPNSKRWFLMLTISAEWLIKTRF